MTSTREHRNAAHIENRLITIKLIIEEVAGDLEELAAQLPDEYPYPQTREAVGALAGACEKALEAQES